MTIEPKKLSVSINERDSVSALLYRAVKKERAGINVILSHGAGAGQLSPFMRLFANGLAERGMDTLTFNFVYMEQGKRLPDPAPKLEACYRAIIDTAGGNKTLKGNRIVIGGKSMGGRIASQVVAQANDEALPNGRATAPGPLQSRATGPVAGLVVLGYPLHPPGKPEQLRDKHLKDIRAPMLFVQGSRDAFGTADEIRNLIKRLKPPVTLYPIEGGDHSLRVSKSAGVPQLQVYENTLDEIARWLKSL